MNKLTLLDCTLRDGGYYNDWDFEPGLVSAYLEAVSESGVDVVELGFRNFPQNTFLGPYAYTTDVFLEQIDLPEGMTFGVMVDASTLLKSEFAIPEAVKRLFSPANQSKISLVRIAAHFNDVVRTGEMLSELKKLGYQVGLNIMQIGGKREEDIAEITKEVAGWHLADVLYFADSFGSMDDAETNHIIDIIRRHWDGPLGIHAHNNTGRALGNTLTARDLGVSWLDATITGMGRGAGNTPLEYLLAVLSNEGGTINPNPVYELVLEYFEDMKQHFGWGTNLMYFLSAQSNVHPTYIQELLSREEADSKTLTGAIGYLCDLESSAKFDASNLDLALTLKPADDQASGTDYLVGRFKGREVLIVGTGDSTSRYAGGIEQYINSRAPLVLSLNANANLDERLVDYYCITRNLKFFSENQAYQSLTHPLILPAHRFSDGELESLQHLMLIDYGLSVTADEFEAEDTRCLIPRELTFGYALAIAKVGGASSISLVGFDGYNAGDQRQLEMLDLLSVYRNGTGVDLTSLTPTTYPIGLGSIYAPQA